ncbi:DNA/RNA helicase domain-containing protein [Cryptosporangium phraense]|uniref:DUF2075 domain-containing protein n=1 Tax=Cryptosporangium phraense TaxID=2593070 RepID=A0A545AQS3_9ACTN|nr:DNA/RNA helicase domain-containing protein [Cryptosporangium phraense]TQS43682.1 DUF2075 domain-containing protein [Cryptosporangium phraense]
MVLVRRSAAALLDDAKSGNLSKLLAEQALHQLRSGVGASELRSWDRSLPVLLTDLVEAGLGGVEVLIEYRLPYSPKRIDVVLCGVDPRSGTAAYVLVELKQWTHALYYSDDLVTVPGYSEPVLHPIEQVERYRQQLIDFTPMLAERPESVSAVAYLHNAVEGTGWSLHEYQVTRSGHLFTKNRRREFLDFLGRRLMPTGDEAVARQSGRAADELLTAPEAPAKPLLSIAAREIQDREQFVLLDEQQEAFSLVRDAVRASGQQNRKRVVIVVGGPGSGKSVIALSLLGELSRQDYRVLHATGSSAFTRTMRKVAGRRAPRVQQMFKYFNDFMEAPQNRLDVLICDEAHRVRETSVKRYTRAALRANARPQIDELIAAARVPVFLLDENQVVRPGEMGSLDEITAAAERNECDVVVKRLQGQYRCGGSDTFDSWVVQLLGLTAEQPTSWSAAVGDSDEQYLVRSCESPAGLEAWLRARMEESGGTGRISAGYCWKWSDPQRIDDVPTLIDDVVIGDWKRPWNAKPDKRVPDAPESYFWASDDRGFGQVGCIYTAQGFEYDWSGVILGPDFVRRDGRWAARRTHSHDPAVKRADDAHFGALIRNTYKVLLTRGLRGVAVYSTDPETQDWLRRVTA